MSFVERQIDVTMQYYGSTNTLKLSGYRVALNYVDVGGVSAGRLSMRIFGVPLAFINEFLAMGPVASKAIGLNKILVQAGNKGEALHTVFSGNIFHAWGDFSQQPNVNLVIDGAVNAQSALTPVVPSAWRGSVPVATIMQAFAATAGYAFQNMGVTAVLQNPSFDGSLLDQMHKCEEAGGFKWTITPAGTLVIFPPNVSLAQANAQGIPILSPQTGLVGYPAITNQGIAVRSIFLPGAHFGSFFTVQGSQIPMANGTWNAFSLEHTLESQTPNGAWFTDMQGYTSVSQ